MGDLKIKELRVDPMTMQINAIVLDMWDFMDKHELSEEDLKPYTCLSCGKKTDWFKDLCYDCDREADRHDDC